MSEFELHPRLSSDCHRIGRLTVSHVLLHRNAGVPWLILVPEVEALELFQIAESTRFAIQREVDAVSRFVMEFFPTVEKINVAAIGNIVPQLHIHVVGRHSGDPCWPDPVWGNLAEGPVHSPEEVERIRRGLADAMQGEEYFHAIG